MAVMEGLATYQLIKTGFSLLMLICVFLSSIGFLFYNINKNFVSTTECTISNNPNSNFEQTVVYYVNNVKYTKNIPPTSVTNNNVTTLRYSFPEGNCTLYYASANPNDYSINGNPTTFSGIIAAVLCVVSFLGMGWFYFLQTNKEFAGVMGGIEVSQNIFGSRRN